MSSGSFIASYITVYVIAINVALFLMLRQISRDRQTKFFMEKQLVSYMEYVAPKDPEEYRNHINKLQEIMNGESNIKALEQASMVWSGIRSYEVDHKLLPAIAHEAMGEWATNGR